MITLPYPPSSNKYWRVWRGRAVTSPEARLYKAHVKQIARDATPLLGDVSVTVRVYRPQKRRDLDNSLKVLLDSLQGIAYENDSQVAALHAYRLEDKANPRVEVEFCPFVVVP